MFKSNSLSRLVSMALIIVVMLACKSAKQDDKAAPEKVVPAAVKEPERKSPAEVVVELKTLKEVIEYVKTFSHDTENETSVGAVLFTLWAKDHLNRKEFQTVPATTHALVLKDSDAERGKRLCSSGRVIQISKSNSEVWGSSKVWEGVFMMPSFKAVRYIAVGETGEIVEGTTATFCGLVIGKYSYSNAGGGTTHAVSAVGEFISYEK